MDNLLGYSLTRGESKQASFVFPEIYSSKVETDNNTPPVFTNEYINYYGDIKNELDLILKYREISLHPEVDEVINDIVNDMISFNFEYSNIPIKINLDYINVSNYVKNKIYEEFNNILDLMNFRDRGYEYIKNWYIDGRIYFEKVCDLNRMYEGLKNIVFIDSLKIKRVVKISNEEINYGDKKIPKFKVVDDFYIYSPNGLKNFFDSYNFNNQNYTLIKMSNDVVSYTDSGFYDYKNKITLSYLHKAIKPLNQLRILEDSLVINKLSRSPQRRIFYIDVGNLPRHKQEQYLDEVISRYRSQLNYDPETGEINDGRKFMNLLEDFWIPVSNGRGTKIETLPSADDISEIKELDYFLAKLYKSLNFPISRLKNETEFSIGRSSEILRDELRYQRFINQLRNRFNRLFFDILGTQLYLLGICTKDEWTYDLSPRIKIVYDKDNHFYLIKNLEILKEKISTIDAAENYVGTYFSRKFIKENVLGLSESEMEKISKEIAEERNKNLISESQGQDFSFSIKKNDLDNLEIESNEDILKGLNINTQPSEVGSELERQVDTQ